jgi:hypothetical protein
MIGLKTKRSLEQARLCFHYLSVDLWAAGSTLSYGYLPQSYCALRTDSL